MLFERISPDFKKINDFLEGFTPQSFEEGERVSEYLNYFPLKQVCRQMEGENGGPAAAAPDFSRLCRLHHLTLTRRAVTILELGSGYSTAVLAEAARLLSEHFGDWAAGNLRVDDPFHVYAVDEDPRFAKLSQERLGAQLSAFATVAASGVEMILHQERIATVFERLPNVMPDLIYVDGPSQFATSAERGGLSLDRPFRPAISADLLRLEFLIEPGALALIEGRSTNARFLRAFLRRPWSYAHDPSGDAHFFELIEDPISPQNRLKLDFCLDGDWLLD